MSNENMNKGNKGDSGVLPTDNTTQAGTQSGVTSKMQAVKSAWDKAPEGQNKANALKHYQSAEKAQKAGNDAEAHRELEEATRALK
jgi:hypothetical protein